MLDQYGQLIAETVVSGFFRRRFQVQGEGRGVLLDVVFGWAGPARPSHVTLADGQELTVRWLSKDRQFSISDQSGIQLAAIVAINGRFSLRPDEYQFDLHHPVLSIVQAVGLAQSVRVAVRAQRAGAGGGAAGG